MAAPAYVTVEEVAQRLRLRPGDVDETYLTACTDAANDLVDNWLARTDPASPTYPPLVEPFPAPVWRAALGVAIRIYRFKDAESDVADSWGSEGVLRIPRDPLAGYRDLLTPYRPGAEWSPV